MVVLSSLLNCNDTEIFHTNNGVCGIFVFGLYFRKKDLIVLLKKIISVALFGALGGIIRSWIQSGLDAHTGTLPLALILINVIGSTLLGCLTGGFLTLLDTPDTLNVGLTTGLMGGFTTFSTFQLTLLNLFKTGSMVMGIGFILVSTLLSIGGASLGQWSGTKLLRYYRGSW
ncbi:hypothetical protein IV81_GL000041 [Pediococcus stilesii]|uniref:Fluoride-specific ion channel FluC n=1 Tax=Pediococcus stilesii TaxID=331679 RepID=A0A0R2L8V1_9LACO|nr:hypothetical protein IV81_GL000041 [Pediococcus stilesii]